MVRVWAVLLLSVLCLADSALAGGPGTVGADFLLIPPAARAAALGEAFTAVADEGFGFHYNPAGLSRERRQRLTTSYTIYLENANYEYLSYLQPLGPGDAFGLSVTALQLRDKRYDNTGNEVGSFSNSDLAFTAAYARPVGSLRVGGAVKYIRRSLDVYSADAFAGDLGVQGDITDNVQWGMSVSNAGSKLKFISDGDPLPLMFRAGIGAYVLDRELLLLADVQRLRGQQTSLHLGCEWQPLENIYVRTGFVNYGDEGIESSFRAGLGLRHSIGDFDYAYGHYGDLGYVHRFTYALGFGAVVADGSDAAAVAAAEAEQREREAEYDRLYREYMDRYYQETRGGR